MISTESSDLYEVTCGDCGTTKSYFTAQGVSYFKSNHEGHKVVVKKPGGRPETQVPEALYNVQRETPAHVSEQEAEPAFEPEPARASHARRTPAMIEEEGPIRLGNLVVDVVDDDDAGRSIKVYGISSGLERFTKVFKIHEIDKLNALLESGIYADETTGVRYAWSPDKIDLSTDVVRMLDEYPASAPAEDIIVPAMEETPAAEAAAVPISEPKVNVSLAPEPQWAPSPDVRTSSSSSDEVLLGKTSYVQEGEAYRLESVRISRVLRAFRWNVEPPYVIGAMFDNLMSVQSQTGMMKGSVIDAMVKLGYSFVAIEAPNGCVTAWFKKAGVNPKGQEEDLLEFSATPAAE